MPIKRVSEEEAKLGRQCHFCLSQSTNEMIHFLEFDKQKVLPSKFCLHITNTLYGLLRGGKTQQIKFVSAHFTIFIGPKGDINTVTSHNPLPSAVATAPVPLTSLHTEDTDWSGYPMKFLGQIPDAVCLNVAKQLSDRWNSGGTGSWPHQASATSSPMEVKAGLVLLKWYLEMQLRQFY